MRQPGGHVRPDGQARCNPRSSAGTSWRANTATGPAPFNPDLVHITAHDEHAYLQAVWPGGSVGGGDIAAWPLRAVPAGPFPAGTGTVSGPWVPITLSRSLTSCLRAARGGLAAGDVAAQPGNQAHARRTAVAPGVQSARQSREH